MANEAAMQQLSEAMQATRTLVQEARDFLDVTKGYALSLKGLVQDLKTLAGGVRDVRVASVAGSLAVTGTFWPATQPVSVNFPAPAYPTLSVSRAIVSLTNTGQVVAAQPGQAIRVLAAVLTATLAVNVEFRGTGATAITGGLALPLAPSLVLPFAPDGWCETAVGDPLRLAFTAAAGLTVSATVLTRVV